MKTSIVVLIAVAMLHCCYMAPVTKNEKEHQEEADLDPTNAVHYARYLKQVVNALESDLGFKKKLEEASEDDIKSGKIAHELDFVSHHVRTKLDELKRVELERLLDVKHQLEQQGFQDNEIMGEPLHGHLDRGNRHTFEIDDLKKLITKTTADLAEADRRRREEFKTYELQKEYEKQVKLNHTNGSEERTKLEKEYLEMEEKHKKHEPLHQPGHKAQLEEVWQDQDHMQQKFEPRAFFMLHDVDSDGYWNQNEVKALFIKELNKLYEAGVPEDDLREREEEMERMREAVFKEMDSDLDGLISMREFMEQTKRNEFEQDHGWKGIDEQGRPYSEEEWQEYNRQHPPPAYHRAPGPGGQYPPPGYGYAQPPQPPPGQYYQGQQPPPPPQYYQGHQPIQNQQPVHSQQPQPVQHQPPVQQPQAHNQQPLPPQVHNQPLQQPEVHNQPPLSPVQPQAPQQPLPGQPHQQQQPYVNQPPPQNQPSPQVNPHEAGKLVQAP